METINGKTYPMWSQFVEKKSEWIGGQLQEIDSVMGQAPVTEIKDVTLEPNGDESAMITFHGENYVCGYDVQHCGIDPSGPEGWLTISSQWGDRFQVRKRVTH